MRGTNRIEREVVSRGQRNRYNRNFRISIRQPGGNFSLAL
jgi:hypothetical protein